MTDNLVLLDQGQIHEWRWKKSVDLPDSCDPDYLF